jgi:putative membrane protein
MHLEMVLWTTNKGIKIFGLKSKQFAEETKVLAANQGLYNGFLAVGLFWSILIKNKEIALFFLSCVLVAGIYGTYSTKKINILYIQSIPAIIAILICLFL